MIFSWQCPPKGNRWIQLADKLPWDDLVKIYNKKLRQDFGAPSIDGRMVIATLIIRHKLNLSDREVIEMIKENIYMHICRLIIFYNKRNIPSYRICVHKKTLAGGRF